MMFITFSKIAIIQVLKILIIENSIFNHAFLIKKHFSASDELMGPKII